MAEPFARGLCDELGSIVGPDMSGRTMLDTQIGQTSITPSTGPARAEPTPGIPD